MNVFVRGFKILDGRSTRFRTLCKQEKKRFVGPPLIKESAVKWSTSSWSNPRWGKMDFAFGGAVLIFFEFLITDTRKLEGVPRPK